MYRSVCLFVLIALSASFVQSQFLAEKPRILDEGEERCVIESKINRNAVLTGDHNNERVVPEATRRCYVGCLLRERGYVHPNGTLHIENLKKTLPHDLVDPNKIIESWETCTHEDGGNLCETAFKTHQCIARQDSIIRQQGGWERKHGQRYDY